MSNETAPKHIDIEAGHFYAGERVYGGSMFDYDPRKLDEREVIGKHILNSVKVAQKITGHLEGVGITVGKSLFVDDTALMSYWRGKQNQGYVEARTIAMTSQQVYDSGYRPFVQFRESELEESARDIVADIQERVATSDSYGLSSDRRKIKYKENGKAQSITLLGKNNEPYDPDYPSCEALDLTLYRKRLQLAPAVVTVLPDGYKPQQERVKKLFEILGEEPAVAVVYFNEGGQISEVDAWSNGTEQVAESIRKAA